MSSKHYPQTQRTGEIAPGSVFLAFPLGLSTLDVYAPLLA